MLSTCTASESCTYKENCRGLAGEIYGSVTTTAPSSPSTQMTTFSSRVSVAARLKVYSTHFSLSLAARSVSFTALHETDISSDDVTSDFITGSDILIESNRYQTSTLAASSNCQCLHVSQMTQPCALQLQRSAMGGTKLENLGGAHNLGYCASVDT